MRRQGREPLVQRLDRCGGGGPRAGLGEPARIQIGVEFEDERLGLAVEAVQRGGAPGQPFGAFAEISRQRFDQGRSVLELGLEAGEPFAPPDEQPHQPAQLEPPGILGGDELRRLVQLVGRLLGFCAADLGQDALDGRGDLESGPLAEGGDGFGVAEVEAVADRRHAAGVRRRSRNRLQIRAHGPGHNRLRRRWKLGGAPGGCSHYARVFRDSETVKAASVLAWTSSSETPGASSISSSPAPPGLTSNTHRSVMMRSTTPGAGQRQGAALQHLGCAVLVGVLHHHHDPLDAGHQVHGAAHALHHLAGDHPVGDVAVLGHLHGAQDRQVDVAAADHREAVGRGEIGGRRAAR